jgi:hypothetical protein
MENQPFPSDVTKWTWETLESLVESGQSENQYLEFKRHLYFPEGEKEKSETEWRRNVEREFTAFANANGGIILFGMTDESKPAPFEPTENDLSQIISQLIQNTTPVVETDVSDPLEVPSEETDRIALAVRVHEAKRKPIATSDSAYYVRINDQKQPMNREQIESLFVEADRRQQAVRQLEMEIDRFYDVYEGHFRNVQPKEAPPNFHLIDTEGLKHILQENNHLYTDDRLKGVIRGIFRQLQDIDSQERRYGRMVNGVNEHPYVDRDALNYEYQEKLIANAKRLYELIEILVKQADLDVM